MEFQKRKSTREVKNDEIENSEMEILDEGVLDKVLEVPGKTLGGEKPGGQFYEVIDDEYFKQSDVEFQFFFIKMQNRVQCFSLYYC